jgi:hypothetical protein
VAHDFDEGCLEEVFGVMAVSGEHDREAQQ